jgi:hypothetical protein
MVIAFRSNQTGEDEEIHTREASGGEGGTLGRDDSSLSQVGRILYGPFIGQVFFNLNSKSILFVWNIFRILDSW